MEVPIEHLTDEILLTKEDSDQILISKFDETSRNNDIDLKQ